MRIMFVALALIASNAFSEPVLITQTYSGLTFSSANLPDGSGGLTSVSKPGEMYVNGAWRSVAGDWVFKILTDSSNPDLYTDTSQERFAKFPVANLGVFATTSITVSNTGLGLVDVDATNYFYYTELIGYQSGISGAVAPDFSSANIEGTDGAIGNPNAIELGKLDYVKRTTLTPTGSPGFASFGFFDSSFGPGHAPLILGDGTTLQGFYLFQNAQQESRVVPEPGTFVLLGLAAAGALVCRRRRATSSKRDSIRGSGS